MEIGEEFLVEDVETTIKSAIGSVLNDTMCTSAKVNDWSNIIISSAQSALQVCPHGYHYAKEWIWIDKRRL